MEAEMKLLESLAFTGLVNDIIEFNQNIRDKVYELVTADYYSNRNLTTYSTSVWMIPNLNGLDFDLCTPSAPPFAWFVNSLIFPI